MAVCINQIMESLYLGIKKSKPIQGDSDSPQQKRKYHPRHSLQLKSRINQKQRSQRTHTDAVPDDLRLQNLSRNQTDDIDYQQNHSLAETARGGRTIVIGGTDKGVHAVPYR